MSGAGKYDTEATLAQESTGGGVILIVLQGERGTGFSAQLTREQMRVMPAILRNVADQIEHDYEHRN